MALPDNQQEAARSFVRLTNSVLFVLGTPSLLLSMFMVSISPTATLTLLYMLLMIISAIIAAVRSKLRRRRIGPYSLCLVVGVVVAWSVALWGFYRPAVVVLDDHTYAPDKSLGTALAYVLAAPDPFTTVALFNCPGGSACTTPQNLLGVSTDYAILTGGVIIGNALIRKRLLRRDNTQVGVSE